MAKNDCIEIFSEAFGTKEEMNELNRIAKKWFKNPYIQAATNGNHRDFEVFYNQALPHLEHNLSRFPNKKELKTLERKSDKYLKNVDKKDGYLASLFKLPENIFQKTPATKKYFQSLV